MKVIVAGSRTISEAAAVNKAIEHAKNYYGLVITEIVEGEAAGVDKLAKEWAIRNGIPFKPFKPRWDYLEAPGAIVKTNKFGNRYNARAGHDRNQLMADYADVLIAVWDGKSTGTKDMIQRSLNKGMPVIVYAFNDASGELLPKQNGFPFSKDYNIENIGG